MGERRTPKHFRSERKTAALDLADAAPDRMRALLAPHVDTFCAQLVSDVKTPTLEGQYGPVSNPAHRGAMALYAQIMRAIGSTETIINAMILQLGVPLDRAREAVALVESVPEDLESQVREARALIAWYDGPNGPGGQDG